MAKSDIDLDDWDLDDDLDFSLDFDAPETPVPDKREALLKSPVTAAKGAAEAIVGEGKRKQLILKSLPEEYRIASDAYDTIADEGRELFHDAKDQYKQTRTEFKRTVRELTPTVERFLPSAGKKLLKKLGEDKGAEGYSGYESEDPRELAINALLTDTFSAQQDRELQAKKELEDRAESQVKEAVRDAKSDKANNVLSAMRLDTAKLVGHANLSDKYRKKMLEVNYRQWYALTDIHDALKTSMEKILPAVDSIVHNTALPDYAKELMPEIAEARMKRQLIEAFSPGQFAQSYFSKLSGNAKRAISDFGSSTRDTLSMMSMAGGMDDGFGEELSEEQQNAKDLESGARTAGKLFAETVLAKPMSKLTRRAREYGENNSTVSNFGNKLAYNMTTMPERLNDMAVNPDPDSIFGHLLSSILPSYEGEEGRLTEISAERLAEADKFDKRTHTTINEIIPGILTRIDHGIRLLRDEDAEEQTYDWQMRTFLDKTDVAKRIRNQVKDKHEDENVRRSIDEMVKVIDVDGDMDDESKKALGQLLDSKMRRVSRFDINTLADDYSQYDHVEADSFDLQSHFALLKDSGKADVMNREISKLLGDTRMMLGSKQERINEISGIMGEKALVDAGIFTPSKDRLEYASEHLNSTSTSNDWLGQTSNIYLDKHGRATTKSDESAKGGIARVVDAAVDSYDERKTSGGGNLSSSVRKGVRDALWGDDEPNLITTLAALRKDDPGKAREATDAVTQKIHEQLVENNLHPKLDTVLEILGSFLENGISVNNLDEAGGGEGGGGPSDFRHRAGVIGGHLKGVAGAAAGTAKRAFRVGRWSAKKAWKGGLKVAGGLKRTMPTPKAVMEGIGAQLKGFKDAALDIADIRDEDGNVVLFGRALKAGDYFGADGKVIKNIKDIKGAVYDKAGKIILSEEEVRKHAGKFTYYAKSGWKKLSEAVGRLSGLGVNKAVALPAAFLKKTLGGFKTIRRKLGATDVYIEGEKSPRLTKQMMQKGYYIDLDSRQPIYTVADISGPVITKHNQRVISEEDIAKPGFRLVDANGEPFKSVTGKMLDKVKKLKTFMVNQAKKLAGAAKRIAGGVVDAAGALKDKVMGKFSGGSEKLSDEANNKIVTRLDLIYELLDERMAGRDEMMADLGDDSLRGSKVAGDVDGDGDRDGGFRDLFAQRREAREKRKAEADAKNAGVKEKVKKKGFDLLGLLGGGLGKIKGLVGMIGGGLASSFMSAIMGAGGKVAGLFGAKAAATAAGGAAASAATTAAGGAAAAGAAGKAGIFSKAASAIATGAKFVGRQVIGQGLRMAAGAAISALGVVSAPVALGALAVGAAAYGIYKFATSVDNDPLVRLRMAQYGTKDYEDAKSEEIAQLRGLETELLKYVTYSNEGLSTIKGVNEKAVGKLAAIFGIETDDEERLINFQQWLRSRFIPIFLLWTSRARQHAPNVAFEDVGNQMKLHPDVQMKILEGVKMPVDHPALSIQKSPFEKGIGGTITGWFGADPLLSGEEVQEVEADVVRELEQAQKDAINKKTTANRPDGAKTLSEQSVDTKAAAVSALGRDKNAWWNQDKSKLKRNEDGSVEMGGRRFKDEKTFNKVRKARMRAETAGLKNSAEQRAVKDAVNQRDPADVTALDAVRLKAYGLSELKVDKVGVLFDLEQFINKRTAADGNKAKAKLDVDEAADMFMARFGLTTDDSRHRQRFIDWYSGRFAAVWLKFVTELKKHAGNANPLNVIVSSSSTYLYTVAMAIVGARTLYQGKEVSIWDFDISPWGEDVPLSRSAHVVSGNLKFLQDITKTMSSREESKSDRKTIATGKTGKEKREEMARDTVKEKPVRSTGTSMNDAINAMYSKKGGAATLAGRQGVSTSYDSIPVSEMSAGEGGEGDYAKMKPSDHSRDSMAELIKKAAKAVGIDSNLLLTVGMMESALNPMAAAGSTSAKGLFQFISSTWKEQLNKHGNRYGIPSDASPFDPVANALLGAEYLKSGAKVVGSAMPNGQRAGPADLYLAHFLGAGGARKFITKMNKDPSRIAARDFGAGAKANPSIFTNRGIPRTYAEVYKELQNRAFSNFRHISKYSDNPGGMSAPKAAPLTDTRVNPVMSQPSKEAAVKRKVVSDADKIATTASAMQPAPSSMPQRAAASTAATESAVNRVVNATTAAVDANGVENFNRKEYLDDLRKEVDSRNRKSQSGERQVESDIQRQALTAANTTNTTLAKMLDVQIETAKYLRQLCERMEASTSSAAVQSQVERRHAQENRAAPKVEHGQAPVSTRRMSYSSL